MPGGLHVASAETLAKGVIEVATLDGFGYRKGLLQSGLPGEAEHRMTRTLGSLAAAYGVHQLVTIGLTLDGRYDRHHGPSPSPDDGYVGDPHLFVRAAKAAGTVHFGGQLGVWVPGKNAPSIAGSAISVDARVLVSLPAGPGVLSFQGGFRLDNSAKSVDAPEKLSLQDRISLGVSDFNALFAGAHLSIPAGKVWIGVEGSLEAFLGSAPTTSGMTTVGHADLKEGTLLFRGGLTAGYHVNDQWSVLAFLEGAKVPGIENSQVVAGNIPLLPYEPVITGGLGLQARFGGPSKGISGPPPCWETGTCKSSITPLDAEVSGTVTDDTGKPLVGAKVTIKGHVYTDPVTGTTDDKGAYKVTVKVGQRTEMPTKTGPKTDEKVDETGLDVTAELPPDRKPTTASVDKPQVGNVTVPPIALQPSLPPGQIKGVVRTVAGKPLEKATITVTPGDKKAETAADGTFAIDLPPGQYKVKATAPGHPPQELDVLVDPQGVALKEFVLK